MSSVSPASKLPKLKLYWGLPNFAVNVRSEDGPGALLHSAVRESSFPGELVFMGCKTEVLVAGHLYQHRKCHEGREGSYDTYSP